MPSRPPGRPKGAVPPGGEPAKRASGGTNGPPGRPKGAVPPGGEPAERASGGTPWLREEGGAVVLALHVQPGARRTEAAGTHGDLLKIRLAAQPIDGKANAELLRFLAEAFGVPLRQVAIERGETSRQKVVRILAPRARPDREWGRRA